jgi:spore maturation protein A
MLNRIWAGMIIVAFLTAAAIDLGLVRIPVPEPAVDTKQTAELQLEKMTQGLFDSAGTAVKIALNLIGIMALFLGLMRILEKAGTVDLLTRLVRPVFRRLFPDIPGDHPAIGAMLMNIASNMLGLGNAATPFGLKAMEELQQLNPDKETASPAMVMFLVINTSAITLIPATVMSIRHALESTNVTAIVIPSILAASAATISGIIFVKTWYWWKERHG